MNPDLKHLLWFIVNEIFYESYQHLVNIFEFIRNTKLDEEIKDLMDEFKIKYFVEGWNILIGIIKLGFLTALIVFLLKYNIGHPQVIRVAVLLTIFTILAAILNSVFNKMRFIRENAFLVVIVLLGITCTNGNLVKTEFAMYEFWFVYCYLSQFCSLMMCVSWQKVVVAHLIAMIYYI